MVENTESPKPAEAPALQPASAGGLFQSRYREVTISAMLFAIVIGVIMNAAITYAGLKIGFTLGGSAIAAVLGFGVLRGLLRKGTILETNIAQTVASAVNTSNSGVIFTVPVLFLLGYSLTFYDLDFWLITLACVAGAMLGTVFIIPLRKQMLDIERLRFPSPTGVATILKSPGAGPKKAIVLLAGIAIAALITLPAAMPNIRYEASVASLDRLVERGEVSPGARAVTLAIDEWMNAQRLPEELIARGEVVATLRANREELEEARSAGDQDEVRRLRDRINQLEAAVEEQRGDSPYNDELAYRAHHVAGGSMDWSALRDRRTGWAMVRMPGYRALGPALDRLFGLSRGETEETAAEQAEAAEEPGALAAAGEGPQRHVLVGDDKIDFGAIFRIPPQYSVVLAIAPFALGAGYITGKAGLFVLAGGLLAYFLIIPLGFNFGWMPETVPAEGAPMYGLAFFTRPLGIGMLLGGALMGVLFSLPAIREAIKSIAMASKLRAGSDELGLKTLFVAVIVALVALFFAADMVGNRPINTICPVTAEEIDRSVVAAEYNGYAIGFASNEAATTWIEWPAEQRDAFMATKNARPGLLAAFNPHIRAAIIAIVGAIWIWFAGIIIAQCAGMTDWSPISGMSLLTVVLVLMLAGSGAVMGAVLLGAALCVAITLAADMMGDMKTGYLVGSVPKRQQITELCVVWMGPIIAMLTLMLIVQANLAQDGIPIGPGTDTIAPQAVALNAVITGVQGGEMPYAIYGFGALLGGLLGLGAFSGLGVLIGISMFLPFFYIATYGVGCVCNMIIAKIKGRSWAEEWGVPFAAGLIVGESILVLLINIAVLVREA